MKEIHEGLMQQYWYYVDLSNKTVSVTDKYYYTGKASGLRAALFALGFMAEDFVE